MMTRSDADEPAVIVDAVRHALGARLVLDGVSLEVPAGEVFGLVGSNGAGRSTLMRILATLLVPAEGTATVAGYSVRDDPHEVRRRIGYLPEDFGVYPRLTATEYVEFYAGMHGVPRGRRHEHARELLEVVGLSERADEPVELLGRGESQRLALARTLVHDPSVLLLEEPTAGLDPRGQVEVLELIGELRGLGKTVVVSSNRIHELAEVATWLGLMDRGRILESGPAAEVRTRPAFAVVTGEATR